MLALSPSPSAADRAHSLSLARDSQATALPPFPSPPETRHTTTRTTDTTQTKQKTTAFFVSLQLQPSELTAKVLQRLAGFAHSCARHGNDTLACAGDAGNFCAPLVPGLMPTARYAGLLPGAPAAGQWPASTCTYRETLAARGLATLACGRASRGARWASCFGLSDSRAACERRRAECVWDALEFPSDRPLAYTGNVRCAPREAADLLGSGDLGAAEVYSALAEMGSYAGIFWGDDCATAQELRRGASACDGLGEELECVGNPLCAWAGARVVGGRGACLASPRANAAVFLLPPFSASRIAPGATTTGATAERVAAMVQQCGRMQSRDTCEAEFRPAGAALAAAAPAPVPAASVGGRRADQGPAALPAPAPALPAPAPALPSVGGSVNVTYLQLRNAKEYNWYQAPPPPAAPLVGQTGGVLSGLARAMGLGGGDGGGGSGAPAAAPAAAAAAPAKAVVPAPAGKAAVPPAPAKAAPGSPAAKAEAAAAGSPDGDSQGADAPEAPWVEALAQLIRGSVDRKERRR